MLSAVKTKRNVTLPTQMRRLNTDDVVSWATKGKHILVLGGNGRLGVEVIRQALKDYCHVTALVRREPPLTRQERANPNLAIVIGSVLNSKDVSRALEGKDAVINCIGARVVNGEMDIGSRAQWLLQENMRRHGVRRLIMVSAMAVAGWSGGSAGSALRHAMERVFAGGILKDKKVQEKMVTGSDGYLDWTVVRPARLWSGQATGKYHASTERLSGFITRADLAEFIMKEVKNNAWVGKVVCIAG